MDKLLCEQILLILKSNVEVYVHGTLESSNNKVRNALKNGLDMTMSMQEDLYNLMTDYNWYQVKTKNDVTGYLREDLIEVSGDVEEAKTNQEEVKNEEELAETTTQVTKAPEVETSATRIVKEDTKLKIVPTINATDIIDVKKNDEVIVVETIGDWVCIEKETTKGWIRADKLMTVEEKTKQDEEAKAKEEAEKQASSEEQQKQSTKTMYANSTTVNVRKEMSKESGIVAQISQNTAVEVISEEGGWYKVKVNGKEGYIATNLLSNEKTQVTTSSRGSTGTRREQNTNKQENAAPVANPGKGATVVETAKKYIGYSYKYGASGPTSFDCSGFTSYIFKQHGISLNRTAKAQYSNGVAVSRANLQPGDLVMFGPSVSGINHVGIYIGGGKIVHAANPSRGVTIDTINSGYYNNNYVGARRVL